MKTRTRVYLESEVYGREYYSEDADIQRLLADAKAGTEEDGITRYVGWEIADEGESEDENDLEGWDV